ncbi:MAG: hypothetical protein AAGJ35_07320, partial [Myxococcota bacterium]
GALMAARVAKVVATITGVANPTAMIEVPGTGQGFIARRGTLIGKNRGRITRIYPDGIVVSENYRDVTGKIIANRVTLRIKRKDKDKNNIRVGSSDVKLEDKREDFRESTRGRIGNRFRRRGAGFGP